jgi:hypothetical protein
MQIEKKVFSKLFNGKTNLSKKVDLALGDNLQAQVDNTNIELEKIGRVIDEQFTPIREIDKIVSNNYFGDIDISGFIKALENLEDDYRVEKDKLTQAENDLGFSINRPQILDDALNQIVRLQDYEAVVRGEVNEYYKELDRYNLR